MKNKKSLIITLVVLVAVILVAAILYKLLGDRFGSENFVVDTPSEAASEPGGTSGSTPGGTEDPTEPEEALAPNFTMRDAQGDTVALEDFRGKPVVLNFWASWCPPCREEMPDFDAAYAEHGEDVHFVMVNLTGSRNETVESGQAFIDTNGYAFPVYFDVSQEGAMRYAVRSVPTTIFIDADGHLVAHAMGMINRSVLNQGLAMITD